jgi:hypothetical protein
MEEVEPTSVNVQEFSSAATYGHGLAAVWFVLCWLTDTRLSPLESAKSGTDWAILVDGRLG